MNERETMIATASFAAGWDAALDDRAARASDQWIVDFCREIIDLNHL